MVLYERSLLGTLGYANDLPRVAAMIAAGNLEPEGMITRRVAAGRDRRPRSRAWPRTRATTSRSWSRSGS